MSCLAEGVRVIHDNEWAPLAMPSMSHGSMTPQATVTGATIVLALPKRDHVAGDLPFGHRLTRDLAQRQFGRLADDVSIGLDRDDAVALVKRERRSDSLGSQEARPSVGRPFPASPQPARLLIGDVRRPEGHRVVAIIAAPRQYGRAIEAPIATPSDWIFSQNFDFHRGAASRAVP